MKSQSSGTSGILTDRVLFDTIPIPMLILEHDVRIVDHNAAAKALFGEGGDALRKRGGEAMHCAHASDVPQGCGRGPACRSCVIRNTFNASYAGGEHVARRRAKAAVVRDGKTGEIDLLVTASPFLLQGKKLVLMILEDVTEISSLRSIIPICSHCKKVRDDEQLWSGVESYFTRFLGLDFSHSVCPSCLKQHYPDDQA